jgi:selenium donor protein
MPIVDDPYDFGRIAATNAISDVYAMGGRPIMALALVGMPLSLLSTSTIGRILDGGRDMCSLAGIPIAGGHTIDSVEPIYGLVVMGLVHPSRVRRNADARLADRLILSKPLGVGILSAALKKSGRFEGRAYEQMIENTTQLNTPGPMLAELDGVHGITDVTGFGLAGHALEMARGSGLAAVLRLDRLPVIEGVRDMIAAGHVTGASERNWDAYGGAVGPSGLGHGDRSLITDPQTSGGLLISCAPETVHDVLAILHREGFESAAEIGHMEAAKPGEALLRLQP